MKPIKEDKNNKQKWEIEEEKDTRQLEDWAIQWLEKHFDIDLGNKIDEDDIGQVWDAIEDDMREMSDKYIKYRFDLKDDEEISDDDVEQYMNDLFEEVIENVKQRIHFYDEERDDDDEEELEEMKLTKSLLKKLIKEVQDEGLSVGKTETFQQFERNEFFKKVDQIVNEWFELYKGTSWTKWQSADIHGTFHWISNPKYQDNSVTYNVDTGSVYDLQEAFEQLRKVLRKVRAGLNWEYEDASDQTFTVFPWSNKKR